MITRASLMCIILIVFVLLQSSCGFQDSSGSDTTGVNANTHGESITIEVVDATFRVPVNYIWPSHMKPKQDYGVANSFSVRVYLPRLRGFKAGEVREPIFKNPNAIDIVRRSPGFGYRDINEVLKESFSRNRLRRDDFQVQHELHRSKYGSSANGVIYFDDLDGHAQTKIECDRMDSDSVEICEHVFVDKTGSHEFYMRYDGINVPNWKRINESVVALFDSWIQHP